MLYVDMYVMVATCVLALLRCQTPADIQRHVVVLDKQTFAIPLPTAHVVLEHYAETDTIRFGIPDTDRPDRSSSRSLLTHSYHSHHKCTRGTSPRGSYCVTTFISHSGVGVVAPNVSSRALLPETPPPSWSSVAIKRNGTPNQRGFSPISNTGSHSNQADSITGC